MNKYKQITKEDLQAGYVDVPTASVSKVAREFGMTHKTFVKALKINGFHVHGRQSANAKLRDKNWLKKRYIDDLRSVRQIADEVGATIGATHSAIRWIGLELRKSVVGLNLRYPEGRFGSLAANWKGGRRRSGTKGSYVAIHSPDHPASDKDGYVMEHRLVMEKSIGRHLTTEEIVHHKNGDKKDNRIENLVLLASKGEHTRHHFEESAEANRLRNLLLEHGINPDPDLPIDK